MKSLQPSADLLVLYQPSTCFNFHPLGTVPMGMCPSPIGHIMKIINSSVRNIAHDSASSNSPRVMGLARKPKAIAQAKKIARKRERAMLRQLAARELLQEQTIVIAEKRETKRIERENAYFELMFRLTSKRSKGTSSAKRRHADPCETFHTETSRVEVRIEYTATGAKREPMLLASCASID